MFILETIRLGLSNLRLHKLRAFLTALGIILGVAAVIIMVSIGEGSKRADLAALERLGARNIIIRSQKPPESSQSQGGQQRSFVSKFGLTRRDMDVIAENFPDVPVVPLKSVGGQVLRGNRRQLSQAFGTTPQLLHVANLTVARGRYLTQGDLDDRLAVAVIGREVAKELFPFDDPLGATFRIDQKVFTVVGLLEPIGLSGGAGAALVGRDLNLDIHIPITSAKAMFGDMVVRRESGSFQASEVQISEVYVVAPSRERVVSLAERVRRVLDLLHPQMTDIGIIVPYELLREAREKAMRWQIVLGAIAGISLLVGGIGIMNIMLATVTERTREIGIRRALGATRQHIVWQFLVETGVLSVAGGLIGIAIGVGASMGLSEFIEQVQSQVTGWSIILAFVVAVATGLVFGIYPAIRAAKQDPIVALRHD